MQFLGTYRLKLGPDPCFIRVLVAKPGRLVRSNWTSWERTLNGIVGRKRGITAGSTPVSRALPTIEEPNVLHRTSLNELGASYLESDDLHPREILVERVYRLGALRTLETIRPELRIAVLPTSATKVRGLPLAAWRRGLSRLLRTASFIDFFGRNG